MKPRGQQKMDNNKLMYYIIRRKKRQHKLLACLETDSRVMKEQIQLVFFLIL